MRPAFAILPDDPYVVQARLRELTRVLGYSWYLQAAPWN